MRTSQHFSSARAGAIAIGLCILFTVGLAGCQTRAGFGYIVEGHASERVFEVTHPNGTAGRIEIRRIGAIKSDGPEFEKALMALGKKIIGKPVGIIPIAPDPLKPGWQVAELKDGSVAPLAIVLAEDSVFGLK